MGLQFFLPLLLLWHVHNGEGISEEESVGILILYSPRDCLLPSPPQWLHSAASLAVELVNNRSDLLPGVRLQAIWEEVDCSPYSTFAPLISALTTGGDVHSSCCPPLVGVVSSTHPLSAGRTAALLSRRELARLHLSLVADQNQFPFSFGMLDTPDVLLEACIALIERSTWRRVNILYDRLIGGQLPFNDSKLRATLNAAEVSCRIAELDTAEGAQLNRHYQLHILFVSVESIYHALCAAFHLNLNFPAYQFLFVIRSFDSCELLPFPAYEGLYSCTADEMANSARGALMLQYKLMPSGPSILSDFGLTYSKIKNLFAPVSTQGCLNPETSLLFDAVFALSLALNNSMLAENQLSSILLGRSFATTSLIGKQLKELSFLGVTGEVEFSNSTGNCRRDISIYQFSDSRQISLSLVGSFSTLNDTLLLFPNLQLSSEDFQFPCPFSIITPPKAISITSFVICTLFALFVSTLHVLSLHFRKQKSIKANSYKLTQLTYVGSYLLILAAVINTCVEGYPDSIPPHDACNLWHMLNSTISLGLTFIFGSLSVRTWRLYRILIHFRSPGRFLSDYILLCGVFACVGFNLVVIVIWSVFDPFVPDCLPLRNTQDQRGMILCTQNNYLVYILLLMVFNLLLIVVCMTFALLTISKYSIDFHLRNTICGAFWTMVVVVVGLPIYFLLLLFNISEGTFTSHRYMFLNLLLFVGVVIVCVFVLAPPLVPVIKERVSAAKRAVMRCD